MAFYYDDQIYAGTAFKAEWLGQNISGARAYADDAVYIIGVNTGSPVGSLPLLNGAFGDPFNRGLLR